MVFVRHADRRQAPCVFRDRIKSYRVRFHGERHVVSERVHRSRASHINVRCQLIAKRSRGGVRQSNQRPNSEGQSTRLVSGFEYKLTSRATSTAKKSWPPT